MCPDIQTYLRSIVIAAAVSFLHLSVHSQAPNTPVKSQSQQKPQLQPQSQATSSWAFQDIRLIDLARFAFSQALNKSFVADDSFLNDQRRVTLDLKANKSDNAEKIITDLLTEYGYKISYENDIIKIRKVETKDEDQQTYIYRPRYRSAQYLIDTGGIFTANSRSAGSVSQSGTSNNSGLYSERSGVQSQVGSSTSATASQESPNSASQYINKTADVVVYRQKAGDAQQTRRTLEDLDQPQRQVDITSVVYEYSDGTNTGSGYGAILNIAKGKFTGQVGTIDALANYLKFDNGFLQILLSAIDSDNRFTLLSSPNVRATSGTHSTINVGADVPTLSSTTQGNGTTTQSVQYQKTGVTLTVTPTVLTQAIQFSITQTLSEAVKTTTGVNNTPTLTNRQISTQLVLNDGEAVVMGGLKTRKQTDTRDGLSFLPTWLHSKTKDTSSSEIIVFFTAKRVVN